MPREKQIIPKYTYPHEETYINDNSAVNFTNDVSDDMTLKYLAVFASGRGKDNTLIYIPSLTDYQRMFGKTNYAKYGQPHLMPHAYLANENVGVWCMRVMPKDATYANSVLSLWYKEDKENKAFRIKFTAKAITKEYLATLGGDLADALQYRDALIEVGSMLDGTAVDGEYVDAEGYTQVPLAVFTAAGRGEYGQNLRWRITSDQDYEKEYGCKFFVFEILDVTDGVTVPQHKSGMLIANPLLEQTTLINDILDDMDDRQVVANIHVFDENVELLYSKYVAFCNAMVEEDPTLVVDIPDIYKFDPFFGKTLKVQQSKAPLDLPFIKFAVEKTADVDETADDYNEADYTTTKTITLDNVAGNRMESGSDGIFASSDPDIRANEIDKMYIEAFSGNLDRLILSSRRIPADSMFDANYSMPVKFALVRLALHRLSAMVYLDTNFKQSLGLSDIRSLKSEFTEVDDMVKDFENLTENWLVSLNTHDYKVKETSTGKRVNVTSTYYLALTDPEYMRAIDLKMISRTGDDMATLSGHIKNSLSPSIDESDHDIKQALTDARINFFESTGENVFVRATDHTFASSNSDLGIEGNVIALLKLKRIMEDEFRTNRNQTTTPELRKDFRDYLLEKYEYLRGTWFDTIDIKYQSNEYESKRRMTHAYIAVSYQPRGEITLIEIDVNPATYRQDIDDEAE